MKNAAKNSVEKTKHTVEQSPNVRAMIYKSGMRSDGYSSIYMDKSTERVWRNCLYPDIITFSQYYRMYKRNNVASRVIETYPDYCWKVAPIITDDRGDGNSHFDKAVDNFMMHHYNTGDGLSETMLSLMKKLDIIGGIGGESIIVFGFNDGLPLSSPVNYKKNNEISWVKILHNGQFKVNDYITDVTSPNYGNVNTYVTQHFSDPFEDNDREMIAPSVIIHSSRVVHFKETNCLNYGSSRIERCFNQLLDITKLSGASAEIYWLGAFSGLSVESSTDTRISESTYDKMKQELEKYFDGMARSLVLEGASAKLLFPSIVSPKDHFDLQITMISIATGIPRRYLAGSEAAKLASQQDTLNFEERVLHRREMFDGPCVVTPIIRRCIDAGVLPRPKNDDFSITWPNNSSISLNDRANASRNMTEAWKSYFASGLSSVINIHEYLLYCCGFSESETKNIESTMDLSKVQGVIDIVNASGGTGSAKGVTNQSSGTNSVAVDDDN